MSKFEYKKIMPRYRIIVILLTFVAIGVLSKTMYLMTAKRDYWMQVADRVKKDSLSIEPVRGNILSSDGQLLASSIPEYKLYMDFKALYDAENDSLWHANLDSICEGLHQIFPDKSVAEFKADLKEGEKKMRRGWQIYDKRVSYDTYTRVLQLPVFRLSRNKSGFYGESLDARQRPYGTLAGRTVGAMYGEIGKDDDRIQPRFGLEMSYDSILRGTNGVRHRRKVLNRFLNITDTAPVDGADIVTTIDVDVQDLAERSLLKELERSNGEVGVAIVMDVHTGDIKAIVNLDKRGDGKYREVRNHAVSDLHEPGSVIKVASIMTALDDGYIDTTTTVDVSNGRWTMYGSTVEDDEYRRGGFMSILGRTTLTVPEIISYSSNIGVSKIIDKYYHDTPDKFVRGLYRTGLNVDLKIPINGSTSAIIKMPYRSKKNPRQWEVTAYKSNNGKQEELKQTGTNYKLVLPGWSNTTLPWMSFGYETQIPPISVLAFYNAIANNGVMVYPRLVKEVVKDGQVLIENPVKIVPGHAQICSKETLVKIQKMLEEVVSEGTGKPAGNDVFPVAGKTGTAQISNGKAGYKTGRIQHWLTFAGYFPANKPEYSCIVCIQKAGGGGYGGSTSGAVFRDISMGLMAKRVKYDVKDARDESSILVPDVKNGNILAADYVLTHLGIKTNNGWNGSYASGNPIWGKAVKTNNSTIKLSKEAINGKSRVPDVVGMGARDAVYLMESRGIRTRIKGVGKVHKQSLAAGSSIRKNSICTIELK